MVSPGDNLAISVYPKPTVLMDALVSHHEQLDDLRIFDVAPQLRPGLASSPISRARSDTTPPCSWVPLARPAYYEHRIDFAPVIFTTDLQPYREANRGPRLDVTLMVLLAPRRPGLLQLRKGPVEQAEFCQTRPDSPCPGGRLSHPHLWGQLHTRRLKSIASSSTRVPSCL